MIIRYHLIHVLTAACLSMVFNLTWKLDSGAVLIAFQLQGRGDNARFVLKYKILDFLGWNMFMG